MALRDKIFEVGYAEMRFPIRELVEIRGFVFNGFYNALFDAGIENYGNHQHTFTKTKRVFPQGYVDSIKRMDFMTRLKSAFGEFGITDVMADGNVIKREEMYWRIVRPNQKDDVGPMHRDQEFHTQEKAVLYAGKELVKCWIPLWCEKDCGLYVYPNSMMGHTTEPRVMFDEPGVMALFNSKTLHGGAVNVGKTARVSMEITLVVDA